MTKTSKTIIFFGTEEFSLSALQALYDADYPIASVVTKPDSAKGRGLRVSFSAVKTFALQHDITVWQPTDLKDILADIMAVPNRVGVLSAYGKIVPDEILDLFEEGIINVHPSLLPSYRGPSPIETALYNGDVTSGVSLMRLVHRMDAGPVYTAKQFTISPVDTATDVYKKAAEVGSSLLVDCIDGIIDGSLTPIEQDEAKATYTHLLGRSDSLIDPILMDADEIDRHVRAYLEFPRTRLHIFGHDIIITKAHVGMSDENTGLVVPCRNSTSLVIDELISPSGKRTDGQSFMNGYAERS